MAAFLLLSLTLLAGAPGTADGGAAAPAASVAGLREVEERAMATCERVLPAVVFIDGGSGFFISADGYLLTNYHVVAGTVRSERRQGRKPPARMMIRRQGGQPLRVEVVGIDPGGDVALLKAVQPGPYPYLELGDSDRLRPGQWVLAMGNPFLLGESPFPFFSGPGDFTPSVSLGVVSALHRKSDMYPDAVQVDVAVNPGSSGGPLVTLDGKVVGINGKIQTRFLVQVNSGVGFAVPSNQIARFLEALKAAEGGAVLRGKILGLTVAERTGSRGLAVLRVGGRTPAEEAGFLQGDRILSIDGHSIGNERRLQGLLATYPAGARVQVEVERDEGRKRIEVVLDPEGDAWLGIYHEKTPDTGGERTSKVAGVRISKVIPGSPAALAGLEVGDVIRGVEGKRAESVVDLIEFLKGRRPGETLRLSLLRAGKETGTEEEVKLRLAARPPERELGEEG